MDTLSFRKHLKLPSLKFIYEKLNHDYTPNEKIRLLFKIYFSELVIYGSEDLTNTFFPHAIHSYEFGETRLVYDIVVRVVSVLFALSVASKKKLLEFMKREGNSS